MRRFIFIFSFFLLLISGSAQYKYPNVQYNEHLQQIIIFVEKKPAVKIDAKRFSFHPELIVAQDAFIVIYLESNFGIDSIFHTCAEFSYKPMTTELIISRTNSGLGRAPFFDSYHNLEIVTDVISWKMNTPTLEFRKELFLSSEKNAFFRSQDFFDPEIMRRNKGYNDKNPMLQLWELFKAYEFQPIPLRHIVTSFGKSQADMLTLLIDFAVQGFVEYDLQDNMIYYKSKLAHYLNNEAKRRDYDNLFWESKSHFAVLNMRNFDLQIYGCDFFVLSDARIVNVYPANETVTVKKNRDLHFTGRVIGGLFDFVARDCTFDYDKFQITMPQIDSMVMFSLDKSRPKDMYGEYPLKKVKNVVEELSGTLFIDNPKNKSGNKNVPDYPIFESREGGKVFFDQPFILNAEYKRSSFYFLIDFFMIKNLDNFNIDSTKISGRLVSGGIFPDIHEPLKLQPDNSLGFIHKTGNKGLPMYGGTAHFYNNIELSNNGLRGKGKITYLTSTIESDSLVFYLQSVRGKANDFHLKPQLAQVEYPEVTTTNAKLFFEPYENKMHLTSQKKPFAVYKETTFEGTLTLSPSNLVGNGILNLRRTDLVSKVLTFKHHAIESEKADLKIYENEKDKKYIFTAANCISKIDFNTRKGDFSSLDGASELRFIKNGFKATVHEFTWHPIDEDVLRFVWDDPYKNVPINLTPTRELIKMNSKSNLLSTIEQGKKGIAFNVQMLNFDFVQHKLNARGVRYIPIGDAAIIPHNGEVTIYENAKFSQLTNARILASRDSMYHELYGCFVQIENGDDFKGNGYYDYIDAFNKAQTLRLDTIWYFKGTRGTASIKPETNFTLSPHFGFSGNVELNSTQQFLTFIGGVSMLHHCNTEKFESLRINQQINPKRILIEINSNSRDVNNRKATVAIASSNLTGKIYTCFGSSKEQINDSEYITTKGFITYNYDKKAFQAASLEKLNNLQLPGNIISLYNNTCTSIGEGAIDMGAKLGRVKFNTHGQVVNYMRTDSAIMHLTTSIDFFFNDDAMSIMNEYFAKEEKWVYPYEDKNYVQSLINILGQKGYEKFERDSKTGIRIGELPEELNVKFLFTTLHFIWTEENAAFLSQKTLPLVISNSRTIYKEIPGRIVIEKRGSKNTLYIYFELKDNFFFFQFENNSLSAISSDTNFNNAIINTKAKDKTLSAKKGQAAFSYKIGKIGDKTRFVKKYFGKS